MTETLLYTPGHGVFTDTLIMYALTSALKDEVVKVEGIEGRYILSISLTLDDIAKKVASYFKDLKDSTINTVVNEYRFAGDPDKLESIFKDLLDENALVQYLKSLTTSNHITAMSEGRGGKAKGKLWLFLAPHLGKYLPSEYKYKSKDYSVCHLCLGLALLGIANAMMTVRYVMGRGERREFRRIGLLLSFDGIVKGSDLLKLLNVLKGEAFERAQRDLSDAARVLSTGTYASLAITMFGKELIDRLSLVEASWRGLVVTYAYAQAGVIQISCLLYTSPSPRDRG